MYKWIGETSARSLGSANTWTDVDLSSVVPEGTEIVLVMAWNTKTDTDYEFGVRKNGSTDSYLNNIYRASSVLLWCGLDANRVMEARVESTAYLRFCILAAFTDASTESLDNWAADDISSATWTDWDVTGELPSMEPRRGIFVNAKSSGGAAGLRANGSTRTETGLSGAVAGWSACGLVKVDIAAGDIIEAYDSSDTTYYAVGVYKGSMNGVSANGSAVGTTTSVTYNLDAGGGLLIQGTDDGKKMFPDGYTPPHSHEIRGFVMIPMLGDVDLYQTGGEDFINLGSINLEGKGANFAGMLGSNF